MQICQRCRSLIGRYQDGDWVTLAICPSCLQPAELAEANRTPATPPTPDADPDQQLPPEPPPEEL